MLWSLLVISLVGSAYPSGKGAGSCHTKDHCKQINTCLVKVTTSQSTNFSDSYTSDRAIDGKTKTCAETKRSEENPWWRIDLLAVYTISSICINVGYESSAQVLIGNSTETMKSCKTNNTLRFGWNNIACDKELSGRYINVSLHEPKTLRLCEVKIYSNEARVSPFKLIKKTMTWDDALDHCRDNYKNLASVVDKETQTFAECEARDAITDFVWLGLRYTCTLGFWFWVDDQRVIFTRWAPNGKKDECDMSGAMAKQGGDDSWCSKHDSMRFNFICAKR